MKKIKEVETSYDKIPYKSKSFKKTQPLHAKTLMKMFGFDTPDLNNARVLEIGCSFGGNIIPMAISYPNSNIVGVDLSKIQIDEGNEIIKKIGLKNIKLYHKNILEYNNEFGKFDYIICHGVFSWVPDEVKTGILKVIRENLSENGVAVVSYNTYPGWKQREIARDLMLFSMDNLKDRDFEINEKSKVEMGKNAIKFYVKNAKVDKSLKEVLDSVIEQPEHYVYHEYFEKFNDPIYMYEFSKMLEKEGLFHVVDSTLSNSYPNFDENTKNAINNECGDNRIAKEQYYDFLRNTQFRISIITHKENMNKINLTDQIYFEMLDEIYVRGVYEIENGIAKYGEKTLGKQNEEILNYLTEIYPKNIKINDLVEKFGKEVYQTIFSLIYVECIEFDVYERSFQKNNLIGPYNSAYIKYSFEENSKISLANFKGELLAFPKYFEAILDVLGIKDENKFKKKIIEKFEKKELISDSETDFSKLADVIINEIKKIAEVQEMFK